MRKKLPVHDGTLTIKPKFLNCYKPMVYRQFFTLIFVSFLLFFVADGYAQTGSVSGTVKDEKGQALPGVSVIVKGTSVGVVSNGNGNYSINVPAGNNTLVFSFVGYVRREEAISNRSTIDLSLTPEGRNLNEVIVVGYGTQRKSDVTGAISSVTPKDFQNQPVNRLDQILQGRVAGVEVENSSGAPGGDVKVRVRGANSILGSNNPLYVIDGYVGADFATLNPEDIESIEVLKDASSTAIYGSRGANGVVLVTTKKGNSLQPEITFSAILSSARVIKKLDLLNAYDFANVVNQRDAAINTNPTFTQAQLDNFRTNGGTNWQNEIYRNAPAQQYQLSLTGGNTRTSYFISTNYLDQDGTILNSGYKRYAIRSNINSKISDKLAIRFNITGDRRENLNTGFSGKISPQEQAIAWAPTTPVRNANGTYVINDPVGSIFNNPVALATDQTNISNNSHANILGGLNYHFIKDLSLDVLFGVDYNNYQGLSYNGASITSGIPSASRGSYETINLQNTTTLNYNHTFNNAHQLNVTAGFEEQRFTTTGFGAGATNLTFPNLTYNNLSLASSFNTSASYGQSTIISFLGRVNYAYLDKYLLTLSVRRDGSSKFQGNNQESTFPSVALGWKLSEEPFIKDLNLFDQLKIRGSWGLTGSQAINPYATLATYINNNRNASNSFNNSSLDPGIIIGNAANPNLKWETTNQKDVGLDAGFFDGRLNFSLDYYLKNTKDLLLAVPLPSYIGGESIISNVGNVKNSGIDLSIGGVPVRAGKFSWTSNFNISFLKNVVENVGAQEQIFVYSNTGGGLATQPEFILKPGYALGTYWGATYLGTWKPNQAAEAAKVGAKPGDSRYLTDPATNAVQYGIIGNGLPKQSLGWNNTFVYSNFTLNVFVQSLLNFKKLNYTYGASITANSDSRETTIKDIQNRYIPGVNETSDIPAFSTTNVNLVQSSRFLEDGDFVRIKNVNLSYHLPKSTLKHLDIRVFVGATNLFTLTKYKGIDPESSNINPGSDTVQGVDYGSYPNSKVFNAGATFRF